MASLNYKTILAALLAGSIAATAGGAAFARGDIANLDPAKAQQFIEKRVDKALSGTDATAEQKKKIGDIMKAAFADLRPLRDKRTENRKAMMDALQAPTIDRVKIEQLRLEQMKIADETSKRLTLAMEDAGDVLSQAQRQAFVKQWSERMERHGKRG
jgi:Spy/CpxP family protein refolding chaperone